MHACITAIVWGGGGTMFFGLRCVCCTIHGNRHIYIIMVIFCAFKVYLYFVIVCTGTDYCLRTCRQVAMYTKQQVQQGQLQFDSTAEELLASLFKVQHGTKLCTCCRTMPCHCNSIIHLFKLCTGFMCRRVSIVW